MLLARMINRVLAFANLELSRVRPQTIDDQTALYVKLFGEDAVRRKAFYNVGSGGFFHPHWTNLDFVSQHYASVQKTIVHCDLMSPAPLPIADGAASIIYTSHTIEHIKDEAVARFFKEAYRCLAPGGYFRVTTGPDADTDYAALARGDEDWFYWDYWYDAPGSYEYLNYRPRSFEPLALRWLHHVASAVAPNNRASSPIKFSADDVQCIIAQRGLYGALDYFTGLCPFDPTKPGQHVSWWTHDKVDRLMRDAGFKPYRSAYGQSRCAALRNIIFFDNTHPQMSLYVEAVK